MAPEGAANTQGKSSTGMDANVAAMLSYVLGLITGLVFFLIEKDNKFVKFHAMQSIMLAVAWFVLSMALAFIPGIGLALIPILNLGGLALWIVCLIKSYQGAWFKLPVIGDLASKQVGGTA